MKKSFSFLKNFLIISFLLSAVIVFAVKYSSLKLCYWQTQSVPETAAALILGAGVKENNEPSIYLKDRLDKGIELYRSGKTQTLIVSGDDGNDRDDEVSVMFNYLIASGIPENHIIADISGYNTYSSLLRVKKNFTFKNITVISQGFHLPRAVFIGRKLGLVCYGLKADKSRYESKSFTLNSLREYPAVIKACFDLILKRKPLEYKG